MSKSLRKKKERFLSSKPNKDGSIARRKNTNKKILRMKKSKGIDE